MSRHTVDCTCAECKLIRIVYALIVAKNHKDIQPGDMEWAITILAVHNTTEEL